MFRMGERESPGERGTGTLMLTRMLSPDGPLVTAARVAAISATIVLGLFCLFVAVFCPDIAPFWQFFVFGLLFIVGAIGQLWQWGFLSINARRAAEDRNPVAWGLVRTGYIVEDDLVAEFLRPGWVFVFDDRVEIFDVGYVMNPRSPSRLTLTLVPKEIRDVRVSRRTRLTYEHIFIGLTDGREVEIEITPRSGWSVRGTKRNELDLLASAIRRVAQR